MIKTSRRIWFDAYTDFDGHMVEYKKWLSKSRSRYFDSK